MRKCLWGGAAVLALLLSACGGGSGGGNLPLDAFNTPPDTTTSPGASQASTADGGGATAGAGSSASSTSGGQTLTADNALGLARSSTDVLVKLLGVIQLAQSMVEDGAQLIASSAFSLAAPVSACGNAAGGPGAFNQVTLQEFGSGFFLPPGKNLHGAFDRCEFGGGVASGSIDISALQVSGDPTVAGSDWTVSGLMTLNALEFLNGDGSRLQFTNSLHYTLQQQGGRLLTTLDVETMNAEQAVDAQTRINYLLEPFYVQAVADGAAGSFTFLVGPGPQRGTSVLNRYTSSPAGTDAQGNTVWRSNGDDIELAIDSTANPPTWAVSNPRLYTDGPVSGEIFMKEPAGRRSIRAVVDSSTGQSLVDLSIDTGGAVTTLRAAWLDLLTPP